MGEMQHRVKEAQEPSPSTRQFSDEKDIQHSKQVCVPVDSLALLGKRPGISEIRVSDSVLWFFVTLVLERVLRPSNLHHASLCGTIGAPVYACWLSMWRPTARLNAQIDTPNYPALPSYINQRGVYFSSPGLPRPPPPNLRSLAKHICHVSGPDRCPVC